MSLIAVYFRSFLAPSHAFSNSPTTQYVMMFCRGLLMNPSCDSGMVKKTIIKKNHGHINN